MEQQQEVEMTYSKVLAKEGKRYVSVSFERGKDLAEGSIPACKIQRNQGFSDEEICRLEDYLVANCDKIMDMAKQISSIKHLF